MKATKRIKESTIKTTEEVIELPLEEIEEIISEAVTREGFTVESVRLHATYKYVEDEWGMNRHVVAKVTGATVYLKQGGGE